MSDRPSSVSNALRLLALLSERRELRVTDVANELNVAVSTAHRLLSELRQQGFARQLPQSRHYVAGPTLLRLATEVGPARPLDEVARSHLEKLCEKAGETVNMQVLTGREVLFLDSVEVDLPLRVVRRAGTRSPAYASAGGKVLLAALPPERVNAILPRLLAARTTRTITTRDELAESIVVIRAQGYATNWGENDDGVNAIAVPVVDVAGRTLAAVSVAAPAVRLPENRAHRLLPSLCAAARAIATDYSGGSAS